MKPEKALELVVRYGAITKQIKLLKFQIGDALDHCRGISGLRGELFRMPETDSKNREVDLHLTKWYKTEIGEDAWGDPVPVYQRITAEEHGVECPHCYEAYLAIEARKLERRKLSAVKSTMSRSAR
jgi:hypothetical protein